MAFLFAGLARSGMAHTALQQGTRAPGPCEVQISEERNGTAVSMRTDQILVLTLPSNPSTGYAWEITALDRSLLKPSSPPEASPGSGLPGAPITVTYRFAAIREGSSRLELSYRRSFEPRSIPAIQRFRVQVRITKPRP